MSREQWDEWCENALEAAKGLERDSDRDELANAIRMFNMKMEASPHRGEVLSGLNRAFNINNAASNFRSNLYLATKGYTHSLTHAHLVMTELEELVRRSDDGYDVHSLIDRVIYTSRAGGVEVVIILLRDRDGYITKTSRDVKDLTMHLVRSATNIRNLELGLYVLDQTVGGGTDRSIIVTRLSDRGANIDATDFMRRVREWNGEVPLEWTDENDFGMVGLR